MNYLTAIIRSPPSPPTFLSKAPQCTFRRNGIKAVTISNLFFPVRCACSRAKVSTTLVKSSMTAPQDSGSSDNEDRVSKSKREANPLTLSSLPTQCRGTRTAKPIVSPDDITKRDFRRLLNLTEAYKYIEGQVGRKSGASLSRLEDELQQEIKVALGQQGLTKAKQGELRSSYELQRKERREQIMRRSLEEVLKGWELSEEGFARLKQVVMMRNVLVHPTLRQEDVVIILRDWKREGGQDGGGGGRGGGYL